MRFEELDKKAQLLDQVMKESGLLDPTPQDLLDLVSEMEYQGVERPGHIVSWWYRKFVTERQK